MRPRLLSSAAAVLSAACAAAADPVLTPAPIVPVLPAEAAPAPKPAIPPASLPAQTGPMTPSVPAATTAMTADPMAVTPAPAPAPAPVPWDRRPLTDDHTGPWNTIWAGGGFGLFWIKDAPIGIPIATTGPLGSAGTSTLLGNSNVGYNQFNALFLNGGLWFDECHTFGFEAEGFLSDQRSSVAAVGSNSAGSPQIVRPFFNPLQQAVGGQDGFVVSSPGQYAGGVAMTTGARIAGVQTNGLVNLTHNIPGMTVNFLAGWRYFDLDEYFGVYQSTAPLGSSMIPFLGTNYGAGNGIAITDRVRTRNQFYGGQLGFQTEYRHKMLFIGLGTTLGVGPVHQVTEVSGQTALVGPQPMVAPGGFLAVGPVPNGTANPTVMYGNIGRSVTNRMAVLGDVKASVGLQITDRWRTSVGYDFLYLTDVVRPGNQLSLSVDPRLVPASVSYGGRAPGTPTVAGVGIVPPPSTADHSDFFVHGVRWTVEFLY